MYTHVQREDSYLTEDTEYMFNLQLGGIRKPKGWNDAHSAANPNSDDWTQAEDAEMEALKSKYTTVSLDEPRLQAKPVGRGMWQYAVKIDKLKARWCFDGSVRRRVRNIVVELPTNHVFPNASFQFYTTAFDSATFSVFDGHAAAGYFMKHLIAITSKYVQHKTKRKSFVKTANPPLRSKIEECNEEITP